MITIVMLPSATSRGVGIFPTKRFCVYFVYTKSMLAYHISIPKYRFVRCIRFHQKNLIQLRYSNCLMSYLLSALYLLKLEKSISYMTCVLITRQQVKTTRQRVKITRQRLKTTRQREILTFLSIIELN